MHVLAYSSATSTAAKQFGLGASLIFTCSKNFYCFRSTKLEGMEILSTTCVEGTLARNFSNFTGKLFYCQVQRLPCKENTNLHQAIKICRK